MRKREKRKKQKKIIIIGSLSLLLFLSIGYAAFSTNLNLKAKGNIREKTPSDYIQDNLFYFIDGISNTKNGHDTSAENWENLIDNGYNSLALGFDTMKWTEDNGLNFDGIDDYIDTQIKKSIEVFVIRVATNGLDSQTITKALLKNYIVHFKNELEAYSLMSDIVKRQYNLNDKTINDIT